MPGAETNSQTDHSTNTKIEQSDNLMEVPNTD